MTAQWDTGWMIWMIILVSLAAICWLTAIGTGLWWLLRARKDTSYDSISGVVCLIAIGSAVVIGILGTVIGFPFSGQYHRFVPKSGTVAKIGFRFLASDQQGGGTTQKYVITFADGRSYGCLDTRCANVAVGDHLTLMCERSFQFNVAYPGWDCNWGVDRKPSGQVIP